MRWLPLQRHAGSKTLHQQKPPVLNWRCRLTQVDLHNGRKMVVVVVVVAVVQAKTRQVKHIRFTLAKISKSYPFYYSSA